MVTAQYTEVLSPQVDRGAGGLLVQPGSRLIDDDPPDEGKHAIGRFEKLESAYGDNAAFLWPQKPYSSVDKTIQLSHQISLAAKTQVEVGLSEDELLLDTPKGEEAGSEATAGGATRQQQPEEGCKDESRPGKGSDQSQRMVGRPPQQSQPSGAVIPPFRETAVTTDSLFFRIQVEYLGGSPVELNKELAKHLVPEAVTT